MDRDQLKEHLTFAGELGVTGVSRDPAWRTRAEPLILRQARDERPPDVLGVSPSNLEQSAPLAVPSNAAEALASVRSYIGDCTRCKLHTLGRKQVVFGVGNPNADLMFVGEAPGADEDIQGEPFVGRAGQPEQDEVETCEPFLFQQIDIVKPKVIVALGKFAAQALLRTDAPISRLRGRVFDYRGAKLIPTFHPAYLLRNPASKREVWEDMKLVRSLLKSEI